MKYWFVLLMILITGCIHNSTLHLSPHYLSKTIYIDPNLSDIETANVVNALNAWKCSTGGMFSFKIIKRYSENDISNIDDPFSAVIIKNVNNKDQAITEANKTIGKGYIVIGLFTHTENGIPEIKVVEEKVAYEEYRPLIEHELGHMLGLSHADENVNAVMHSDIPSGAHMITQADVKQFCDIYMCEPDVLKACH